METRVEVDDSNFHVVDTASGTTKTRLVFHPLSIPKFLFYVAVAATSTTEFYLSAPPRPRFETKRPAIAPREILTELFCRIFRPTPSLSTPENRKSNKEWKCARFLHLDETNLVRVARTWTRYLWNSRWYLTGRGRQTISSGFASIERVWSIYGNFEISHKIARFELIGY